VPTAQLAGPGWPDPGADGARARPAALSSCDPDDVPGGLEGPDNDGDECNFTITGSKALPTPPVPPDPSSEFATGSPQLAAQCSKGQAEIDRQDGNKWVGRFSFFGASDAADFLRHFLDGTGTPIDRPDGSALSVAVKNDSVFTDLDKIVQAQAKKLLDSGQQTADVTSVLYNPDFSQKFRASLATQAAFGGTQGLDVSGSGYQVNGSYVGTITYVIRDIYGFYAKSKFFGLGPEMHYLQGVCGAPWYPGGAHWFPDSVTVTIPFDQPVG
jgi:hypothetical protein